MADPLAGDVELPSGVRVSRKFLLSVLILSLVVAAAYFILRRLPPGGAMDALRDAAGNPALYGALFFGYAVAATLFLPIPVELGLFFAPDFPYAGKALILGLGKAVGGFLVFQMGLRVEDDIREWSRRIPQTAEAVRRLNVFVDRYGTAALFVLLSIPLMVDTVPLYLFSLFNRGGKGMDMRRFLLANFGGGVTRAVLLWAVLEVAGVNLAG